MNSRTILAVAVVALMAVSFAVPMEQSDSTITSIEIVEGKNIYVDRGNTVTIHLKYTADQNTNCTVSLYDVSSNKEIWSDRLTIDVGTYDDYEIVIDYDKSGAASVPMKLTFMSGSTQVYEDVKFTLTYNTSIWSNPAIYVTIIVIVILVIALVVYKSRMAPSSKNQMTFEQVEAMKAAEKSAKKPAPAKKSERQRYLDSKKK